LHQTEDPDCLHDKQIHNSYTHSSARLWKHLFSEATGRMCLSEISRLQDKTLVVLGWMVWMVSWCSRSRIHQSRTIGI
jgi:hypothetical protein